LLKAYFDGSWNGKPPGITSVAGYVASLAEWERVETEWQRGLDEWSMDRFHLSGLRNIIGAGEEMVASVNVVEIRGGFEVAIGQAARGGSLRVSVSASGASSSAIASTCM
jgi:hypothetical protein